MGRLGTVQSSDAAGHVSDYVISVISDLETAITQFASNDPAGRIRELLYLIGMVKLAACEAKGITPLPGFQVLPLDPNAAPDSTDCSIETIYPWAWVLKRSD